MRMFALTSVLALSSLAQSVVAHELWIEPLDYQVERNGQLQARIVNGQEFDGTNLPYIDRRFVAFDVYVGGANEEVTGRNGDTPALNMPANREGLNVVVYQSTPSTISYATWEKFQTFIDHKDLGEVRPVHIERGLPLEGFSESYVRYSKSLIGVGDDAGSDLRTGLETELVALKNPYTDDLSEGMDVQLFYQDEVRANVQVEVFAKDTNGDVTITYVLTDNDGIARIPVEPQTAYQLDAVVLRPAMGDVAETAAYETLWANLTFATP